MMYTTTDKPDAATSTELADKKPAETDKQRSLNTGHTSNRVEEWMSNKRAATLYAMHNPK